MNKTRYSIVFIFILLFGSLFSCSTIPRANRALGQLSLGNPHKSWQMISDELKHPTVSSQEDLCELHLANIQILQQIVTHDFAPDDPDIIAKVAEFLPDLIVTTGVKFIDSIVKPLPIPI